MNETFTAAINQAAREAGQVDRDKLPAGLSPQERKQHLLKLLRECVYEDDTDRETRIRARYPEETERLRTKKQPVLAFETKDRAYFSGLEQLVRRWATVDGATDLPARLDIEWLNRLPGPTIYPAKLISQSLTMAVMENTVSAALPGLKLPKGCTTLSQIKRMIRAAKLNAAAGAVPFGSIASVVGDKLVGKRAVNIGENGGRKAVRITVGGKKLWLRLDVFEAGLEAIGYGAALDQVAKAGEDGSGSEDSMVMNVVNNLSWESVLETPARQRDSGIPTEKGLSSATAPIAPKESVLEAPLAADPPTLSERITGLGAHRRAAEQARAAELAAIHATGIDALTR